MQLVCLVLPYTHSFSLFSLLLFARILKLLWRFFLFFFVFSSFTYSETLSSKISIRKDNAVTQAMQMHMHVCYSKGD